MNDFPPLSNSEYLLKESFLKELAEILFMNIFQIDERPTITSSNLETFYNHSNKIINLNIYYELKDYKAIIHLAHECYHFFDFRNKPTESASYSHEDSIAIQSGEWWREYNYQFEIDAICFSFVFVNFYRREILSIKRGIIPHLVSREDVFNHPTLIGANKRLNETYLKMRTEYYPLLIKNRNKIRELYNSYFCNEYN